MSNDKINNAFRGTRTGRMIHAGQLTSYRTDCGEIAARVVRPTLNSRLCERCFSVCHAEWLKAVSRMFYVAR